MENLDRMEMGREPDYYSYFFGQLCGYFISITYGEELTKNKQKYLK